MNTIILPGVVGLGAGVRKREHYYITRRGRSGSRCKKA